MELFKIVEKKMKIEFSLTKSNFETRTIGETSLTRKVKVLNFFITREGFLKLHGEFLCHISIATPFLKTARVTPC